MLSGTFFRNPYWTSVMLGLGLGLAEQVRGLGLACQCLV